MEIHYGLYLRIPGSCSLQYKSGENVCLGTPKSIGNHNVFRASAIRTTNSGRRNLSSETIPFPNLKNNPRKTCVPGKNTMGDDSTNVSVQWIPCPNSNKIVLVFDMFRGGEARLDFDPVWICLAGFQRTGNLYHT